MRSLLARSLLSAALLLPCSVLTARGAAAQPADQKATAEVAFQRAMKLMEEGDLAKACALLEDSQRLDPQMGTEYQLAQCYEKGGRLASAWARYRSVADAARAAKMADREAWAAERAKELEARLSTITIVVPPEVAAIAGLRVERNGVVVGPSLFGEATFVDGGSQRVSAEAPGRRPWSTEVAVATERARQRVEVPLLPVAGQGAGASAPSGSDPTAAPEVSTSADEAGDGAQAVAGAVVAAVGLATLGAGVVVGLVAKSSYDSSGEEHCTELGCDETGVDEAESARTQGDVATALFVVGGAALVAGVITWLAAPSESAVSSSGETAGLRFDIRPRARGALLEVGGRW